MQRLFLLVALVMLTLPVQAQVTGQPEVGEVVASDSARFEVFEREAIAAQQRDTQRIQELAEKLANVEAQARQAADLTTQLAAAQQRLDLLEQVNRARFGSEIDLERLRFRTGREVLSQMIGDSEKLKFTLDLATVMDDFSQLANPMNSSVFKARFEEIEEKRGKNSPILSGVSGFLSNPYVSAALSLSSLFTSRLKRDVKTEVFHDITCVVDFSTRTQTDLRVINTQLGAMDTRLNELNTNLKTFFRLYAGAIGYTGDWDMYREAKQRSIVADPTDDALRSFINHARADSLVMQSRIGVTSPKLAPLKYNVEQLTSYVDEYEGVLKDMDTYLRAFQEMVRGYADYECSGIEGLQNRLASIDTKLEGARMQFGNAYDNIPPQSIRILYGIYFVNP
ncbi:MAG: hypothetical protein RhofKO_34420 [Rhodothermales bacterium]